MLPQPAIETVARAHGPLLQRRETRLTDGPYFVACALDFNVNLDPTKVGKL